MNKTTFIIDGVKMEINGDGEIKDLRTGKIVAQKNGNISQLKQNNGRIVSRGNGSINIIGNYVEKGKIK